MKTECVTHMLKTEVIGTTTHTYEVIKENTGAKGKEVVIIGLYPTIGIENVGIIDKTNLYIQNKMGQLGWSKVHVLNLFSQIIKQKPLTKDLSSIDDTNIAYLKSALEDMPEQTDVVIAWGNSHTSNKIVNKSKAKVLTMLRSLKSVNVCQIVTEKMTNDTEGTHLLFLGLRHSDEKWIVEAYPVEKEIVRLAQRKEPSSEGAEKIAVKKRSQKKDTVRHN